MSAKNKAAPLLENIAEAGAACLVTMVQGNVLALGISHWLIASQTGIVAGTAATAAIVVARTDNRLVLAGVLGLSTAVVDYFVHPGMIGAAAATEAIVTGLAAGALSYSLGALVSRVRQRRAAAAASEADLDEQIMVEKESGE